MALFVLLIIAFIVCGPFVTLWCLQTLGIGEITYSFAQWFAALILLSSIGSKFSSSKKE